MCVSVSVSVCQVRWRWVPLLLTCCRPRGVYCHGRGKAVPRTQPGLVPNPQPYAARLAHPANLHCPGLHALPLVQTAPSRRNGPTGSRERNPSQTGSRRRSRRSARSRQWQVPSLEPSCALLVLCSDTSLVAWPMDTLGVCTAMLPRWLRDSCMSWV